MTKSQLPSVIINMAMSLDGRISTRHREQITLGSTEDRRLMDLLRSRTDAVIVGAGTVRHDGYPVLVRDSQLQKQRKANGRSHHPTNIILSHSLDMPMDRKIFNHNDTDRIIFTTESAPAARRKRFEKIAEVVVAKTKKLLPRTILGQLAKRGYQRILLEGGGEINFAFVEAHVVNEIYVTITPRLIGGKDAPSILDGRGFLKDDHIKLKLASSKRIGDELFLRYRVSN